MPASFVHDSSTIKKNPGDDVMRRVIHAAAPIRICDCGGWTDTWFAGSGCVFNIGVEPSAHVTIDVRAASPHEHRILLHVEDFDDHYSVPGGMRAWDRHPLLEAAIAMMGVPQDVAAEITVRCAMPAGASTGTSAAVTVALIAALNELSGKSLSKKQIARTAHAVEVEKLGLQSGIQDQLCAAFGGVNFITIQRYPDAEVTQLPMSRHFAAELESRLKLVYLGTPHRSSDVHQRVIDDCVVGGSAAKTLELLRRAAVAACDAVLAEDLSALGEAMVANTHAQAALHPSLLCSDAVRAIAMAQHHGCIGWKVNGAGGEGGSLTLLRGNTTTPDDDLAKDIAEDLPGARLIRTTLQREGVTIETKEEHGAN